jgi:hypothetical protein
MLTHSQFYVSEVLRAAEMKAIRGVECVPRERSEEAKGRTEAKMGLPPNAIQHFAKQHVEAVEKHLNSVEDNLFKEANEDRRAFEKFYYNLALFSGGTIALSITYLGYLKTLAKTLSHQRLLMTGWAALFVCLLLSLNYVLVTLYYGHHFREREWAEAKKRKLEVEAQDIPKMGVENLRTSQEIAEFQAPRMEQAKKLAEIAAKHEELERRYLNLWRWSGRIAQLSFATGIGLILWFAISNT